MERTTREEPAQANQISLLHILPQELRDEIYKYTFDRRVEFRQSALADTHPSFISLGSIADTLGFRISVSCALLVVSKQVSSEVQRLLDPAHEELLKALLCKRLPGDRLGQYLRDLRPRVRFVCDDNSRLCYEVLEAVLDSILPLSLDVVFTNPSVSDKVHAFNWETWGYPYYDYFSWSGLLCNHPGIKTFSLEMPVDTLLTTHTAALELGNALLENGTIEALFLISRQEISTFTRQKDVECIFRPLHGTKDAQDSPRCINNTVDRAYDLVDTQPWTFENNEPWFSDGEDMRQVIRITRWADTQLGSATYEDCVTYHSTWHTPRGSVDEISSRLQ